MQKKRFKTIIIILMLTMFLTNYSKGDYNKVFFDHDIKSINGENIDLKNFSNKVVLIVNVASYCGFTKQYDSLQKLWETYKGKNFIVLGVPSNSFGQEKSNNEEVKDFCNVNFNITFPMTSIYSVKGDNAHEIYKWAKMNYGKSAVPKWNFHKILINKDGKIDDTFAPFTDPLSKKITNKIDLLLK